MHNDDPKPTDVPTDAQTPPEAMRFLGPFVRLTDADDNGTDIDVWVRWTDVSGVLSTRSNVFDLAPKRSQTRLAIRGRDEFVAEPRELVLALIAEAEERAGKTRRADEDPDRCYLQPYEQLAIACKAVIDASGLEYPNSHAELCAQLAGLANRVAQRIAANESALSRSLSEQKRLEADANQVRADFWAISSANQTVVLKNARMVEALQHIRLAIDAAGRDVQALVNVEMILDSVADAVHFCDRQGNPIKGGSHADAQAVQP